MTRRAVIYVGVDGSWRDTGALEWALQEAELRHEPLCAIHVIDEAVRGTPYWSPIVIDDTPTDLLKAVQSYLESSGRKLDHDTDLLVGPPEVKLADAAEGSTMLVVGRRGMGAFKRLLIGSTSEAAAHQATIPVVVVPNAWNRSEHSGPVILALDDSGENRTEIEFAVTAAERWQVPLRLVHVWDLPNLYSRDVVSTAATIAEWDEGARRYVDSVADEVRPDHPGLITQADVRRGHPVDGLIAAAQASDAQLLVVGGRRHHRVTSMLLGSVARGVLHHATCPVAVVHPA
ncbi:nucleotide-binding universal stress UspA family protein [Kribbella orskensis]|uniref:Nucleotide-binding universal stress UspA family protein n=1 Tax=Kribbella orskensis TaxID=2512216 RepID=A0ABY2B878_9ACTN|nr:MULTISPECIES: universal stress protein [Kribbella]TCN27530.1 nucleotide-binding universal stress UspA family protein [Kribbella sp. VKM Ac-2500]TCO08177.1 nucleotide-binding universal stress UspA family protein [Kribbella orskensis]